MEAGCGTGALADRLLATQLPDDARYTALDASPTMLGLARDRLRGWGERVLVEGINGHDQWPVPDSSADRVVATYIRASPEVVGRWTLTPCSRPAGGFTRTWW